MGQNMSYSEKKNVFDRKSVAAILAATGAGVGSLMDKIGNFEKKCMER